MALLLNFFFDLFVLSRCPLNTRHVSLFSFCMLWCNYVGVVKCLVFCVFLLYVHRDIAGLERLSGCTVFLKYRMYVLYFLKMGNVVVLVAV